MDSRQHWVSIPHEMSCHMTRPSANWIQNTSALHFLGDENCFVGFSRFLYQTLLFSASQYMHLSLKISWFQWYRFLTICLRVYLVFRKQYWKNKQLLLRELKATNTLRQNVENSHNSIGVVENRLQWTHTNTVCQSHMKCNVTWHVSICMPNSKHVGTAFFRWWKLFRVVCPFPWPNSHVFCNARPALEFEILRIPRIPLGHCVFASTFGVQKTVLKDSATSASGIKSYECFATACRKQR